MQTGSDGHGCFIELRRFSFLACLFGFALSVGHAGAAVIDNFDQGSALLSPTNYSPAVIALQTGLNTNSTIGGTRRLSAQTLNRATLQVKSIPGELSFESVSDFGYFNVAYGTEKPLGVDLKADGSEAFLLTFSNVSMPGLWRGIYNFRVNGTDYDLLPKLAALNGNGTIRIPFSHFSSGTKFVVSQISLDAARVESSYHLVLDSITTVPPLLNSVTLGTGEIQLRWSTNVANYTVETSPTFGGPWQTMSNRVTVVGGQYTVTVGVSQPRGYFRLRRQ